MDTKRSVGGAGTLVGLSASVYLSSHSTWAGDHPAWAWILYIATGIFVLFTVLQFGWVQRLFGLQPLENQKPVERKVEATGKGIAIRGDVSGSRLDSSSGHSYIGDSAIKARLEHERELFEKLSPQSVFPPTPKIEAKVMPVLSLGIYRGSVDVSKYMVNFAKIGGKSNCYVVSVHNERAAARGEEAVVAEGISASIALSPFGMSSRVTRVPHACWVDEVQNEISLRPGDTAHVLIGITKKDEWILYENPKRYPVEWPSTYHDLDEISLPLYPNLKMVGEISILAHKHDKTTTLTSRKFAITVDSQGFSVNAGWDDEA